MNKSTLSGMFASWALVKWYSELASVLRATVLMKLITFFGLLFANVACSFQIVESEYVLEFSLIINNRSVALFLPLSQ